MNQETEKPEVDESQPAESAEEAEEKPRSARRKKATAAEQEAEAVADATEKAEEKEPVVAEAPPPAAEGAPAPAEAAAPETRPAPAPAEAAAPEPRPAPAPAPRPERRRHGRYTPRRKVCSFCVDHVDQIDYKDVGKLRRYLSDRGKVEPRRKTGTCAKHQRRLTIALKRARHVALLPYTADHIRLTGAFAPRS